MSELSDKLWERLPKNDYGNVAFVSGESSSKHFLHLWVDALSAVADITPKPDPCEVACQKAWDGLPRSVDKDFRLLGDNYRVSDKAFPLAFRLGYEAKGAT